MPTQFAWLDSIVKERFSAALAARGAYSTHRVFSVNTLFEKRCFRKLRFSAASLPASNVERILEI